MSAVNQLGYVDSGGFFGMKLHAVFCFLPASDNVGTGDYSAQPFPVVLAGLLPYAAMPLRINCKKYAVNFPDSLSIFEFGWCNYWNFLRLTFNHEIVFI